MAGVTESEGHPAGHGRDDEDHKDWGVTVHHEPLDVFPVDDDVVVGCAAATVAVGTTTGDAFVGEFAAAGVAVASASTTSWVVIPAWARAGVLLALAWGSASQPAVSIVAPAKTAVMLSFMLV
jgi:hypothetical protein